MDKRQELIMEIMEKIAHEGTDSLSGDEYLANDVLIALFNIVLQAGQRTGNPEVIDSFLLSFSEMCQQVKDRMREEKNAQLE